MKLGCSENRADFYRYLKIAVALSLPILTFITVVLQIHFKKQVASLSTWKKVFEYVESICQGDKDLVYINPWWAQEGVQFLKKVKWVNESSPLTRDEIERKERVIEVATFGATLPKAILKELTRQSQKKFDQVRVRVFTVKSQPEISFDFTRNVKAARVFHKYQDGRIVSVDRWFKAGWYLRTLNPDYLNVKASWWELGDTPKFVIWAHPVNNATLHIEYPDIPMGNYLTGLAGLGNRCLEYKFDTHVKMELFIDGQRYFSRLYRRVYGYFPFKVDTRSLRGEKKTVRFEISSNNPHYNQFMFSAECRK